MKWKNLTWLAILWALGCGMAMGEEQPLPSAAVAGTGEIGAGTRQWLDSQRQGKQAAAKAQPLSGPVQEQVYERYRKSFSQPIPQRFDREEIGSGTGSR